MRRRRTAELALTLIRMTFSVSYFIFKMGTGTYFRHLFPWGGANQRM